MTDPKQRFSSRAEDYARHRPSYPTALVDFLRDRCDLARGSIVADVGSGTGVLSRLLLQAGALVLAIEPNAAMRAQAESGLASELRFVSVAATAESTGLAAQSVDIVTVAQAFHWFDREQAMRELLRIVRPQGWIVLVWNLRLHDATPFLRGYEAMLRAHANGYPVVEDAAYDRASVASILGPGSIGATFRNRQDLDLEHLRGRLLSSSYAPLPGEPQHDPMMRELDRLFEEHAEDGKVAILYETQVTACRADELALHVR